MVTFTFIVDFVVHFPRPIIVSSRGGVRLLSYIIRLLRKELVIHGQGQLIMHLGHAVAEATIIASVAAAAHSNSTRPEGSKNELQAMARVKRSAAAALLAARHHVVITKSNSDWDLPLKTFRAQRAVAATLLLHNQ